MHTIALEEHFATQARLDVPTENMQYDLRSFPPLVAQLCDLGDGRIAHGNAEHLLRM